MLAAIVLVALQLISAAQQRKTPDISAVAASGTVTKDRYTNSYFKLSVDAPNATLTLNPLVNAAGARARLVQIISKSAKRQDQYTFAVLADALSSHPQLESTAQYIRSVRHMLEKEDRLRTTREEFPITIGGVQFTGAIMEEGTPAGEKVYRGMYATFRNGYILMFDAQAPSPDKLNELVARVIKLTGG